MKAKAKRDELSFKPIILELTLETEDEVAAMFALFNVRNNCGVLHQAGIEAESIRESIISIYGDEPERTGKWFARLVS
jgi:hypothetical protein